MSRSFLVVVVTSIITMSILALTALAADWQKKAINLSFTLSQLELQGQQFQNVEVQCDSILIRSDEIACPGAIVSMQSKKFGRVRVVTKIFWRPEENIYRLQSDSFLFAGGKMEFALEQTPRALDFNAHFDKTDLKLLWSMWSDYLPEKFNDYAIDSGVMSGDIDCAQVLRCEIGVRIDELNFSGANAAENAALEISLIYHQSTPESSASGTQRLTGQLKLVAGAVYVEPGFKINGSKPGFLLLSTDSPLTLNGDLDLPNDSNPLKIRKASISHPGVVEMDYTGDLQFNEEISWQTLSVSIDSPQIDKFYETYVQPVIFGTTLDSLELSGAVKTRLSGRDNEVTDLNISVNDAYFDDDYGRFALYRLHGDFALSSAPRVEHSQITWEGASIYGLTLGGGQIDWGSQNRNVWIAGWDAVSIFDGELNINELSIAEFGTRDAKLAISGSLSPVSMREVMATFGLPPMSGKVSASIPELSFQRNKLILDGDIEVKLFDGILHGTDLEIGGLFSPVPRLYANVEAKGLNLALLTSTFSFGNISGTLDGYINDLRLEAWQPLSFDAFFGTRENDEVRHRISRQAVDNLGRIGAQTSALSSGWLRFIPNYSYGQLGLGCRFERGYCTMSGVENAADDGFYVLTQGGIIPPWINIKGRGKLISWQNLIDGIKQISTGEVAFELGADAPQQVQ